MTLEGTNCKEQCVYKILGKSKSVGSRLTSKNDSQDSAELTHQGSYHVGGHQQGH